MNPSDIPTLSEGRKKSVEKSQVDRHLRTHTSYSKVYIVVVGDMTEGFEFYGPFSDARAAMSWAVANFKVGEGLQIYPMNHVRGIYGGLMSHQV